MFACCVGSGGIFGVGYRGLLLITEVAEEVIGVDAKGGDMPG